VATSSRKATARIVGMGMRVCRHSGWRAAQKEMTDADQKPAPTNAAVIAGSMGHEKKVSVWRASTNSWVPAKKVRPVRTYSRPRMARVVWRGPTVAGRDLVRGGSWIGWSEWLLDGLE
jgi:hypothetical protein